MEKIDKPTSTISIFIDDKKKIESLLRFKESWRYKFRDMVKVYLEDIENGNKSKI